MLVRRTHTAALVAGLCRCAIRAADNASSDVELLRAVGWEAAARRGVHGRLVVRVVVHVFHDVDLATGGPVGAVGPEGAEWRLANGSRNQTLICSI